MHAAHLPTPSGQNQVWQPATVRNLLTNQVSAGHARDNYRQPSVPKYHKKDEAQRRSLTTGRRYRPDTEWVWSEAPALIAPEVFAKAPLPWRRNAEVARKMSQPSSRRSLLRRRVKCGECGLGMGWSRDVSVSQKRYEYLYYHCKGHSPLTCGRVDKCPSRRVRADRLDPVVWDTLCPWLRTPALMPHLHQAWAQVKQQNISALAAQQAQLLQRRQRLERQSQRLLDAYQAEIISLDA